MAAELQELTIVHGDRHDGHEKMKQQHSELTVDEIIEEHVGAFGFLQLLHVLLVALAWTLDAQATMVAIFSDKQPEWRCRGSPCSPSGTDICTLDRGVWEWVDGDESSTVAEWGLVCGKGFQAGIPSSMFFIGSLIGSVVHGRLADTYLGRKNTVLLSCISTSITSFLTSLAPNIWAYAVLRFAGGLARSGIGICCLVLSTEVVGARWRGQVGQYGFFFFTVGFLCLPVIAYPARTSWRSLYKVISVLPLAYAFAVLPFVSESPRWLAVKGRRQEAMHVLAKLARGNGRTLPENVSLAETTPCAGNAEAGMSKNLWSATWARRRMATVMAAGLGIGFVYYGVQLNVENLGFNIYFASAVNAVMEIPAVFVGSVLLSVTDRRALLSSSAFLAGGACLLCAAFSGKTSESGESSWLQLSAEAVGLMAASAAFDVMYVFCVELFPTNVRNLAVSILRQAFMLGAAATPLLVVLGRLRPSVSFLVFGTFAVLSGFLAFALPETRNAPLYETLEQQEEQERLVSGAYSEVKMAEK